MKWHRRAAMAGVLTGALVSLVVVPVTATAATAATAPTPGDLDPSFGSNGVVYTNPGPGYDTAAGIAVDASGRTVVVGTAGGTYGDVFVARFLASGAPDTGFGTNGVKLVDLGQPNYPT